ncbi:hypothetical protein M422DRAFT_23504, partial [Sphaerobolus stellatus SS14]
LEERKGTVQSTTLHDYFGSSSKKLRVERSSPQTKADGVSLRQPRWQPEDIIVITDDEEEEEVRVIEQTVCIESNSKISCIEEERDAVNGQRRQEELVFPRALGTAEDHATLDVDEERTSRDDYWAMGDDENTVKVMEDDIMTNDERPELCGGSNGDEESKCPVCNKDLKGMSATIENAIELPLEDLPSNIETERMDTTFSILMFSHKDNDAWNEVTAAESMKGKIKRMRPDLFINVTTYFLTHAHSDHYTNLSSSWKNGPIHRSQMTAKLIIDMLKVDSKWVVLLPMDVPTIVLDTGSAKATLIQANHCLGSVLFLFEGLQTADAGDSAYKSSFIGSSRIFRHLHCGDFRACPRHVLHTDIKGKKLDTIYLDTTYLDLKCCFPPQPLVISACAKLVRRLVESGSAANAKSSGNKSLSDWLFRSDNGAERADQNIKPAKVLAIVGTYTIGKERIVKAIAKELSTKIYCDARKVVVLKYQSDPELHALLTDKPLEAGVHIVPLHAPPTHFRTYHIISRDQARTFTYTNLRPMRNSTPRTMLYGVPYSEHSSFFELTCFALSLHWTKMITTVDVEISRSRGKMEKWFEKWR